MATTLSAITALPQQAGHDSSRGSVLAAQAGDQCRKLHPDGWAEGPNWPVAAVVLGGQDLRSHLTETVESRDALQTKGS